MPEPSSSSPAAAPRARSGSFDGLASRVAAPVMARMNADMERAAVELLRPAAGDRVLVVGFGPGVGVEELCRRATGVSVLGLDPSAAMGAAARRRLAGIGPDRVELRRQTLEELEPAPGSFNRAVAVNTHQLFEPHSRALAVLGAAVRPGGRFVSVTHDWAIERRLPLGAWRTLVEADAAAAGFRDLTWSNRAFRSGPATLLVAAAADPRPSAES